LLTKGFVRSHVIEIVDPRIEQMLLAVRGFERNLS